MIFGKNNVECFTCKYYKYWITLTWETLQKKKTNIKDLKNYFNVKKLEAFLK